MDCLINLHSIISKKSFSKKSFLILLFLINSFFTKAQFDNFQDVSNNLKPTEISVADINNDGLKDLIVAENSDLIWMENQGTHYINHVIIPDSFSAPLDYIVVIETGDFDNNGFTDIIFSENQGTINESLSILYNTNGVFNQVTLGNFSPITINIEDIDGDNDLDIITTDLNSNIMFINNGTGVFSRTDFEYSFNYRMRENRITDLDGDSLLDLVSFERKSNNTFQGFVVYLDVAVNQTGYQIADVGFCKNLAIKDINNDSKPDIVFMINKKLLCHTNIDSLNWAPIDTIHQFSGVSVEHENSLWIEDFRNDNTREIIFYQDRKLHQLVYNGITYNEFVLDSIIDYSDSRVDFVDMNGDGFLDIVSAGGTERYNSSFGSFYDKNHISILESSLNNQFNRNIIYDNDADRASSAINIDIDNDGDNDISVTTIDKQIFYENLGGNVFSNHPTLLFEGQYSDVYHYDFNGDGQTDFIAQDLDSLNVVYLENQGNNSFNKTVISLPDSGITFSLSYVDYDGDGDMDICMNNEYNFYMIPNLGNGNFGSKTLIYTKTALFWDIEFADFNGNGFPDLIYTYAFLFDRNVAFVPNNAGVFGNEILISNALFSNSPVQLQINAIQDYDNDGDLDLFVNDYDEISWILNDSGYPITNIATVNNVRVGGALDIDQDGDLDYIYSEPSSFFYKLAINDNGTYNSIELNDEKLYSTGKIYFGDFNNNLKDLMYTSIFDDDVWFFKNNTDKIGSVKGTVFYDQNQNKLLDPNESGLHWFNAIITPQSLQSFSDNNGQFSFLLSPGNYQLSVNNNPLWNLTTDSSVYNIAVDSSANFNDLNFGMHPDTVLTKIDPVLTGGFPRCNTNINYWIDIRNIGTTLPSGVIHLQLDDSISYVSSSLTPDSINGQNVYWNYNNLFFFSSELMQLQVQMPNFMNIGDTLSSILVINELDVNNNIIYSNSDTLDQVLVCAYDPNDKSAVPNGYGTENFIVKDQQLEYLIRFQNTGNDTALTIVIRDQLDTNLDITTFQPISSSHTMQVKLEENRETVFTFNNILLPDSNINEPASHGFIKYSISPKTGLLPNTPLQNTANIFFDSNPPIITNTVLNTIECYNTPQPVLSRCRNNWEL